MNAWTNVGVIAGVATAVIALFYKIAQAAKSLWAAFAAVVVKAVDESETGQRVERTEHIVNYHLGPNGTTTPMHERMRRLEVAHDIEDTPH